MRNIRLTISYDGSDYYGFQRQKDLVTVQQVLEEALAKIFGESISVAPSGRTDTGVHALGQVVSFKTQGKIPVERVVHAVNTVLPPSVVALDAKEMPEGFHARYDAKAKKYIYKIMQTDMPDPFLANYAWLLAGELDVRKMAEAASIIKGEHDFSSFRASGSTPTHPVRDIYESVWQNENGMIVFSIKGNGFLYHMVRNLVGSFVDIGQGRISVDDFKDILAGKDRALAGKTAPPQGLYLEHVFY